MQSVITQQLVLPSRNEALRFTATAGYYSQFIGKSNCGSQKPLKLCRITIDTHGYRC